MTTPSDPLLPPTPHGPRENVAKAAAAVRDGAADAARRTAQTIEANPLSVLVGGLAVGVLAGALLPRHDSEHSLLAPLGRRIAKGAGAAARAARDVGLAELTAAGISRDAARDQVKKLVGSVVGAARNASDAAMRATRREVEESESADGGDEPRG